MTFLRITPALVGLLALSVPAVARAQSASAPFDAAAACVALKSPDFATLFANLPEAVTTIRSATVVPAGGDGSLPQQDLPEICRVEGQITPTVGFLLRMPTKTWNGKFIMGGCGGPCGNYLEDRIDPALVRNYAVVNTDMGHKGEGWGFGYNNVQGLIDFGYRATHVTAVAAKEIVKAYYGRVARYNYFQGCSTGGRQALIAAQRFPKDFDGIIGGAPPMTQTGHQTLIADWAARINTRKDGSSILNPSKLPLIHNAVLNACDALDGLKDGVLQHPPACSWQPKSLQCKSGTGESCLTADEVGVVEKIYAGASWSDGTKMYLGQSGRARGTELKWAAGLAPPIGTRNSQAKYWDIHDPRGPSFDDNSVDIDRDIPGLASTEWIFHHTNPDLRNFKALGGKFIFFGGWDDECCRADAIIDYYETVTRVMGGPEHTQDFMRLFLPAGMDHCRYGIGGGEVDWLTALENWVEKGQAPEQVIAYHMLQEPYPTVPRPITDYGAPYMRLPRHPLAASEYDRAHPVYPYPDSPRYSGRGDPNDPRTWQKAPRKSP